MSTTELPLIDEHERAVSAPMEVAWDALERWTARHLLRPAPEAFASAWRLVPSSGFAVVERLKPSRLVLAGHHRFARYELILEVDEVSGQTTLQARTFAAFPGALGRLYRAAVIESGGHALVIRGMLRSIANEASASRRF